MNACHMRKEKGIVIGTEKDGGLLFHHATDAVCVCKTHTVSAEAKSNKDFTWIAL